MFSNIYAFRTTNMTKSAMRVTLKNEHRYNIKIIRLEIEIKHDKDGEDSKETFEDYILSL